MDTKNKSFYGDETVSPTKSRFGRTHKPKVLADFLSHDQVFSDRSLHRKMPVPFKNSVKTKSPKNSVQAQSLEKMLKIKLSQKLLKTKSPSKSVNEKSPSKSVKAKSPLKLVKAKSPSKLVNERSPSKSVKAKSPSKLVKAKSPSKLVKVKSPSKSPIKKSLLLNAKQIGKSLLNRNSPESLDKTIVIDKAQSKSTYSIKSIQSQKSLKKLVSQTPIIKANSGHYNRASLQSPIPPVTNTRKVSPNIMRKPRCKKEVNSINKDLDIYMNAPKQITPLHTTVQQRSVLRTMLQPTVPLKRKFFKSKPVANFVEDVNDNSQIDFSKVMKIVCGNPQSCSTPIIRENNQQKNTSAYQRSFLKSFSNKRTNVYNNVMVESFGLPDVPIVPVAETTTTKPKRIRGLDVECNAADVTLSEPGSFLHTTWPLTYPAEVCNPVGRGINRQTFTYNRVTVPTKTVKAVKITKTYGNDSQEPPMHPIHLKDYPGLSLKEIINIRLGSIKKSTIDNEVIELDDEDDANSSNVACQRSIIVPNRRTPTKSSSLLTKYYNKNVNQTPGSHKINVLEEIIIKKPNTIICTDEQTLSMMPQETPNLSPLNAEADNDVESYEVINEEYLENSIDLQESIAIDTTVVTDDIIEFNLFDENTTEIVTKSESESDIDSVPSNLLAQPMKYKNDGGNSYSHESDDEKLESTNSDSAKLNSFSSVSNNTEIAYVEENLVTPKNENSDIASNIRVLRPNNSEVDFLGENLSMEESTIETQEIEENLSVEETICEAQEIEETACEVLEIEETLNNEEIESMQEEVEESTWEINEDSDSTSSINNDLSSKDNKLDVTTDEKWSIECASHSDKAESDQLSKYLETGWSDTNKPVIENADIFSQTGQSTDNMDSNISSIESNPDESNNQEITPLGSDTNQSIVAAVESDTNQSIVAAVESVIGPVEGDEEDLTESNETQQMKSENLNVTITDNTFETGNNSDDSMEAVEIFDLNNSIDGGPKYVFNNSIQGGIKSDLNHSIKSGPESDKNMQNTQEISTKSDSCNIKESSTKCDLKNTIEHSIKPNLNIVAESKANTITESRIKSEQQNTAESINKSSECSLKSDSSTESSLNSSLCISTETHAKSKSIDNQEASGCFIKVPGLTLKTYGSKTKHKPLRYKVKLDSPTAINRITRTSSSLTESPLSNYKRTSKLSTSLIEDETEITTEDNDSLLTFKSPSSTPSTHKSEQTHKKVPIRRSLRICKTDVEDSVIESHDAIKCKSLPDLILKKDDHILPQFHLDEETKSNSKKQYPRVSTRSSPRIKLESGVVEKLERKADKSLKKDSDFLNKLKKNTANEKDDKDYKRNLRVPSKVIDYSDTNNSKNFKSPNKSMSQCPTKQLGNISDDVEFIKRTVLNTSTSFTTTINSDIVEIKIEDCESEIDTKPNLDELCVDTKIKDEVEDIEFNLFSNLDVKTEVKEEPADGDMGISKSTVSTEIKHGDLAFAKLGYYPYWPCLVTKDPSTSRYIKMSRKGGFCLYHVRFFGDRGRRSWIRKNFVIPFNRHTTLDKVSKKVHKMQSSFKRMWQIGVDEATALITKTIEERYEFFFNMFASTAEKKQVKSTFNPAVEIETMNFNVIKVEDDVPIKLEDLCTEDDLPLSEIVTKRLKPKNTKGMSTNLQVRKKDETESLLVIKNCDQPINKRRSRRSKLNNEDTIEVKLEDCSLLDKNKDANPEIKLKLNLNQFDMSSECSLSDTDSSSKWSIRTPILVNNDSQTAMYKRNNLFKGVQRDRVCQICFKLGTVIKCKGMCYGYYHKECTKVDTIEKESDVKIVLVKNKKFGLPKKLALDSDPNFKEMSLGDQIDYKLKEVMDQLVDKTIYADSTTDYTSSEDSSSEKSNELTIVEHVAADDIIKVTKPIKKRKSLKSDYSFKCGKCSQKEDPPCWACGKEVSPKNICTRQKCSISHCGKYYHPECLKIWPQTQYSFGSSTKYKQSFSFTCPMHICHICVSDNPRAAMARLSSGQIVRCMKCPATYHSNTSCIPAGTNILSSTQIICPRHSGYEDAKKASKLRPTLNTTWCFICSRGGDLICCDTCPTSVHIECSNLDLKVDETFICEDCETGRLPLYDETVWVKLGSYRWWPALILFPNDIPETLKAKPHDTGEFVVKLFGTHEQHWVSRGRVFLFQEDDNRLNGSSRRKVDLVFKQAVKEAAKAHSIKKEFKVNMEGVRSDEKPPSYVKIRTNKPVGNVKLFDGNVSNTTPCFCDPNAENPCGPDSYCLNRMLLTECDPEVCPAEEKCQNQKFEKRQYPHLAPYKTVARGWGLKTLEPLKKGQFVIEYVGELIDDREYQRRMAKMHEQKDDNYYFLTIDNQRMIDAGPKGNMARFMNHCCEPNCDTQKWTVKGVTRVGLFANQDVPEDTEVTFNYNLESVGEEKKVCRCGAPSCSGFIGAKTKNQNEEKKPKKLLNKLKRKRSLTPQTPVINNEPCFICGKAEDTFSCHNKICTKYFHVQCVNLESKPDGKWSCPWHNCNICSKRTIRCCVKCINSYCPLHSEGNVRHDKLLGFICTDHDPSKEPQEIQSSVYMKKPRKPPASTEESDVTSTTHEESETLGSIESESSSFAKHDDSTEDSFETNTSESIYGKKKRGRSMKKKYHGRKKIKMSENPKAMNVVPNKITAREVILTRSVPERHLRVIRKVSEDSENERLLKRQRAYEKDLPIRKRTTPRTESTHNK